MKKLRILLVEDDAVVGALLSQLLIGLGHDVCQIATTESEAVAAAAREAPDLMIVDESLRQGSGIAAMEAIRRRGAMPHIFMTGNSRLTMPANAVVLRKPFGMTELTAALDGVVAQLAEP